MKHKLAKAFFIFSLILISGLGNNVSAQEKKDSVQDQIHSLQKQLDQLKSDHQMTNQFSAEENVGEKLHEEIQQAAYSETPCPSCENQPIHSFPFFTDNHDQQFPSVQLTGFFQADAVFFSQDAANRAAVGDVQDGADFRRARLAAKGDAWENVSYMVEFDFAFPGRPSFMDVWLQVNDVAGGNIRIGHFVNPFGMDALTSVRELTFLERGLPFTFMPFRQIGAKYDTHNSDETVTWAISGFRYPTDFYGGNIGDDGGYGMATRLTGLLIDNGDDGILHVGAGYTFADPANDQVRYRNQPEVFVAETGGAAFVPAGVPSNVPPFVDTGNITIDNFSHFNLELATAIGSFYAQSEFFFARTNQTGLPRLFFPGSYVHAGYFLTGEKKPYKRTSGVLGRVTPLKPFGPCGKGAWEVAARWSYINLNDKNIQGGRLNDITLGLNWYLNKYTKFQLNYIHAFLGTSPAVNGPVIDDSNADIIALRAQVDF